MHSPKELQDLDQIIQNQPAGTMSSLEWQRSLSKRNIADTTEELLLKTQLMLNAIDTTQFEYIIDHDCNSGYHQALSTVLNITKSSIGFIGEVFKYPPPPKRKNRSRKKVKTHYMMLRTLAEQPLGHAIAGHYWDSLPDQVHYDDFETALGAPVKQKQACFFNEGAPDDSLPFEEKHGEIHRYCGIPLYSGKELVGMLGIANKQEPYTADEIHFLSPLLRTIANAMRIRNTEKKRTEAEQNLLARETLLRSFINNTPAAITMLDNRLNYLLASPGWKNMHNIQELEGTKMRLLHVPKNRKWAQRLEKTLKGHVFQGESAALHLENDQKIWVKWAMQPWFNSYGAQEGAILFMEDITPQKDLEEQLQNSVSDLKISNDELGRYAHSCAHDLKEPMRTIASFSHLLKDSPRLKKDEALYLHHIIDGTHRMQTLIDDMLTYAQLDVRTSASKNIDLRKLVTEITQDLQALIEEKSAEISIEADAVIKGNFLKLKKVFQNLIHNALKFNESTPPKITIAAKEGQDVWILTVTDNGIGIDAKYIDHIFQMFNRIESRYIYPGSGMGLAICKKIIEQHKGTISAHSERGVGTTFTIEIPKTLPF